MKISISLSDDDAAFLDGETLSGTFDSRSAAVHAAVRLLRESRLTDAYAEAFTQWDESDDVAWDAASGDGMSGAVS